MFDAAASDALDNSYEGVGVPDAAAVTRRASSRCNDGPREGLPLYPTLAETTPPTCRPTRTKAIVLAIA